MNRRIPLLFLITATIIALFIYQFWIPRSCPQPSRAPSVDGPMIVIELPEHPGIAYLRQTFATNVNNIIAQEISKTLPDYQGDLPTLKFPPDKYPYWTTLLYVGPIEHSCEPALVPMIEVLQKLHKGTQPIEAVTLSPHYDFFGEGHNVIVVKIDAPHALYELHRALKHSLCALNHLHQQLYGNELMSEIETHYRYVPHVTIGKLPTGGTEPIGKGTPLWDNVKKRIIDELFSTIRVPDEDKNIEVNAFTLYSSTKERLHEFVMA